MAEQTGVTNLATLSEVVEARGATFPIEGVYEAKYRPVVDAFRENFRAEDETGSACSVIRNGKTVVDIWGGFANRERTKPWEQHSTVCMMSVAKRRHGHRVQYARRSRPHRRGCAGRAVLAGVRAER